MVPMLQRFIATDREFMKAKRSMIAAVRTEHFVLHCRSFRSHRTGWLFAVALGIDYQPSCFEQLAL
jgi:hypothetical protein